jgi:hypothetical protein
MASISVVAAKLVVGAKPDRGTALACPDADDKVCSAVTPKYAAIGRQGVAISECRIVLEREFEICSIEGGMACG